MSDATPTPDSIVQTIADPAIVAAEQGETAALEKQASAVVALQASINSRVDVYIRARLALLVPTDDEDKAHGIASRLARDVEDYAAGKL